MIFEDTDDRAMEKSFEFSAVPECELAELTEQGVKKREKRARKKANQKARKAEAAAEQALQDRMKEEQRQAEAAIQRKEALIKPHEALGDLFRSGALQSPIDGECSTSDNDSDFDIFARKI
mmetsp:Transcript_35349/g.62688  ORF Transcript_35349/g.62688 Transcript_35349/m.62688 type:complete len:121 (+) Transcript_35349:2-364(+)